MFANLAIFELPFGHAYFKQPGSPALVRFSVTKRRGFSARVFQSPAPETSEPVRPPRRPSGNPDPGRSLPGNPGKGSHKTALKGNSFAGKNNKMKRLKVI